MKKRWTFLLLILLAVVFLLLHRSPSLTMNQLLFWQPENLFLAAVILLAGYAIKSLLVFVPIMILQILAGHLYSRETALLINLLGLVIVMAVPYWFGKCLGAGKIDVIIQKYPKLKTVLQIQQNNEMAMCFLLRACSVPPVDIVTMYLGASGTGFLANVLGGVLGQLPGMVLTTFLGASIRDPKSPAFWKSLSLNVLWVVLSGLGFYLYKKFGAKEKQP